MSPEAWHTVTYSESFQGKYIHLAEFLGQKYWEITVFKQQCPKWNLTVKEKQYFENKQPRDSSMKLSRTVCWNSFVTKEEEELKDNNF